MLLIFRKIEKYYIYKLLYYINKILSFFPEFNRSKMQHNSHIYIIILNNKKMFKGSLKLSKPNYLRDKQERKEIDNYLQSEGRGGYSIFDTGNKQMKNRHNDLYKPVIDQARIYEMHQIEKRYKMNFEQKKKGYYSSEYLLSMSSLLNRNSKHYIQKRQALIEKFQPLYTEEFRKKFEKNSRNFGKPQKPNFYLTTTNFGTIDSSEKTKKHKMIIKSLDKCDYSKGLTSRRDDIEIKEPIEENKFGTVNQMMFFEDNLRKEYDLNFQQKKNNQKTKKLIGLYNGTNVNYKRRLSFSKRKYLKLNAKM